MAPFIIATVVVAIGPAIQGPISCGFGPRLLGRTSYYGTRCPSDPISIRLGPRTLSNCSRSPRQRPQTLAPPSSR